MELTSRDCVLARTIFQRHQPHGYRVQNVTLSETDDSFNWEVTYYSDQMDIKCSLTKQKMQISYHNIAKVGSVSKLTTISGLKFWKITFYPEYKFGVLRSPTQPSTQSNSKQTPSRTLNSQEDEFTLLVRRGIEDIIIPIHEYCNDTDLPKKLFRNGKNVTSAYTRRTTLCRTVVNIIKDHLTKGIDHVLSLLRPRKRKSLNKTPIQFVKEQIDTEINIEHNNTELDKLMPPFVEDQPSLPKVEKSNRTYASVAYDYAQFENMMQLKAMTDPRVFKAVRMYILSNSSELGLNVSPIIFKSFRKIELANIVKTNGLPINSSLLDIYIKFCKENGICNDVVADLISEMSLAVKLGTAIKM